MQRFLKTTVTALMALAIATGAAGCGDSETKKSAIDVDKAFVTLSITLNENAIAMSDRAAKEGKSADIKYFASQTAAQRRTANEKLTRLAKELEVEAGGEPSTDELSALGWKKSDLYLTADDGALAKGDDFDDTYVKLMRQNIDGSIRVARPEVMNGKATELVDFAKQVISERALESDTLDEL